MDLDDGPRSSPPPIAARSWRWIGLPHIHLPISIDDQAPIDAPLLVRVGHERIEGVQIVDHLDAPVTIHQRFPNAPPGRR